MQRREFVIGGAGVLAGVVFGHLGGDSLVEAVVPGPPSEVLHLDTWLGSMEALGPVGLRRLEMLEAAAAEDRDSLAVAAAVDEALAAKLRLRPGRPVRVTALERRLRAAVEADYREGRICDVDGWQLSETECELSVLYVQRVPPPEDEPAGLREGHIVTVEAWGPRSTEQGERFNEQSDGHSGLWFRAPGAPPRIQVVVDGDPMPTFVAGGVVTSGLHGETQERVLSLPGRYPVVFVDEIAGLSQTVGHLEVRPPRQPAQLADGRESAVFCVVEAWGPRETRAGVGVNVQDGGDIGLWVRIGCTPPEVRVWAGGSELRTVRGSGRVTARLPMAMVQEPGEMELSLHDPESGERLHVGVFTVYPTTPGGP